MKNIEKENDFELISSVFDEELPKSNIDCESCKKVIEDYKTVDLALNKMFKNSQSANFSEKIIEIVRKNNEKIAQKPKNYLFILRAVASLFIFGAIGVMLLREKPTDNPQKNKTNLQSKATKENTVDKVQLVQKEEQKKTTEFYETPKYQISLDKMQPVGFGNTNGIILLPTANKQYKKGATVIADNVRHVWTAKDLNQSLLKIIKIAEVLSIRVEFIRNGNNTLDMSSRMTKKQLVYFVKNLSSSGFKLLSSQAPQPEDIKFKDPADILINYTWTIVVH